MTGDWRQRARERVGVKVEARMRSLMEDEPLTSDEFDTAMRRNQLEALQDVEPSARLEEELTLRLMSEEIPEGLLLVGTADPILRRLQDIITAAASTKVQLGLVGISRGSTVLHLCPVYAESLRTDEVPEAPASIDVTSTLSSEEAGSSVDRAMHDLMRLVEAAESGDDLEASPSMLKAFEDLVTTLDKSGIDVDLGWHADTGSVRTSKLTSAGRHHIQSRMRPQVRREIKVIRGFVTEVSAPSGQGRLTVKSSMNQRRGGRKVEIDRSELIDLGLAFGEWIEISVTVEQKIDALTTKRVSKNVFHELIERRRL